LLPPPTVVGRDCVIGTLYVFITTKVIIVDFIETCFVIEPTSRKNPLTFGGDLVLDSDA